MQHRLFVWLTLALLIGAARAQSGDVPFDKEHISDAARLKTALAAIKKADGLAQKGGVDYAAAMAAYEEAYAVNPDNAELNQKMGVCILNGPYPHKAVANLQRAAELDPYRLRIHFLLGHALQLNAQWDEAIAAFKRHGEIIRLNPDPDRTYNMVEKRLRECRNGKSMMANPGTAQVSNLGPAVNSPASEFGALFDGRGNLYFTGRRPTTTGGRINKVTNTWYEDVFHSQWGAGGWSMPRPAEGLNGPHNDATVALSADGATMIIYRDEKNGGDLFTSKKVGGTWSSPVPLPATINSAAQESSAWLTDDGKLLYFVSSRDGGFGGSDIYRSAWDQTEGNWGTAENLGPDINTMFDEEGVYAPGNGSTLYFASQGHNTMGGYDLFKASYVNGRWSKPENLGWPINSPGDDQFLVLDADGKTGYFSSVRSGGMGEDDIYRVDFPTEGRSVETAMLASAGSGVVLEEADEKRIKLVGFVKGLKMMPPVEATVALMSLNEPSFNATVKPDPATGGFTFDVPAGKDYALHVTADGYMLHSEHVKNEDGPQQIDLELKPVVTGSAEVMHNIFFENSSYRLDSASVGELHALQAFLEGHPDLRLEVGGHTDSDQGAVPNLELSQARAQVVVNWLVRQGISPDRLEAKGYGATQPVVPNDSPDHKARNRRTEIRVL